MGGGLGSILLSGRRFGVWKEVRGLEGAVGDWQPDLVTKDC